MGKNVLPYYKAYPRDFIEGTIGMSLELKGAYRVLLDLIYMQAGHLRDDARYISGLLGCSVRKWETIRVQLICAGKIQIENGKITNSRARLELESTLTQQKLNAENGAKAHKNKDLLERPLSQPEPEPEPLLLDANASNTRAKKSTKKPPPNEGPFRDAIKAQSAQGRARLDLHRAWSSWQKLAEIHGEKKLLDAFRKYLSTDKDALRDNGDFQMGLQRWLNQKAEVWLGQVETKTDGKPDIRLIRAWLNTNRLTNGMFEFNEERAGMTKEQAKIAVAQAEADGTIEPLPVVEHDYRY